MNGELQSHRAWALKLQNRTGVALVPSWAIASLKSENVSRSVSDSLRPMDCSPPGSSVHGILQARILEWVAISYFREFSLRDGTWVSCIAGRFLTI